MSSKGNTAHHIQNVAYIQDSDPSYFRNNAGDVKLYKRPG